MDIEKIVVSVLVGIFNVFLPLLVSKIKGISQKERKVKRDIEMNGVKSLLVNDISKCQPFIVEEEFRNALKKEFTFPEIVAAMKTVTPNDFLSRVKDCRFHIEILESYDVSYKERFNSEEKRKRHNRKVHCMYFVFSFYGMYVVLFFNSYASSIGYDLAGFVLLTGILSLFNACIYLIKAGALQSANSFFSKYSKKT